MNTNLNIVLLILLLFYCGRIYSQQKVEGLIFDKDTKQRIGRVLMINKSSGANVFNNSRGEFALEMQRGDKIIAQKENYFSDTLTYKGEKVLIFNLKKTSIYIDPVTVVARKTPEQILADRRRDYDKAYKLADPGSYLSVGPTGAGLSINAIYNLFSKEAKNARRLTKYFQKEYEENIVDIRFSKELVKGVTGLEGEPLDNFMVRYRPSYDFVSLATHYQMVSYIKSKYEYFKFVPYIKPLPDLDNININNED
ncbi:hypothetical protein [Sphingobacterium faecale]|uniref:Carboxypeptidase-like regulatory domain-containing protein n=1 Tax=Sphingobacterium faecale TaxID=2803775 RepID=A0ABS1R5N9_9SPHI|nr:hypothetical protein [Sphingobacterium faecale]MBL1409554.1 hypothetical protein [Sphingobacterium faecale]